MMRCSARDPQPVVLPPAQVVIRLKGNSYRVFHALTTHQILFFISVCCRHWHFTICSADGSNNGSGHFATVARYGTV